MTIVIAGMLFFQYQYFKQEAQELSLVKEAYYQHVEMLKRSLNASILQNGEAEQESESKKKKILVSNEPFIVDAFVEKRVIESSDDFKLISRAEEDCLSTIKANIKKIKPNQSIVKRKKNSRKSFSRVVRKPSRYIPQRDFIFCWPLDLSRFWLSSLFGLRKHPAGHMEFHKGIDMAAVKGTPVKAAAAGTVILAQLAKGFGKCVMLQHNNRYKTRYAHLDKIGVSPGQVVMEGAYLGNVGNTGLVRSSGGDASHLHFGIYQDDRPVNPLRFLFT